MLGVREGRKETPTGYWRRRETVFRCGGGRVERRQSGSRLGAVCEAEGVGAACLRSSRCFVQPAAATLLMLRHWFLFCFSARDASRGGFFSGGGLKGSLFLGCLGWCNNCYRYWCVHCSNREPLFQMSQHLITIIAPQTNSTENFYKFSKF